MVLFEKIDKNFQFNSLFLGIPEMFLSILVRVCVCVCVCVCVLFTTIHREGFIYLGLEFQGTDQQYCVEDVAFLCQVPSSIL